MVGAITTPIGGLHLFNCHQRPSRVHLGYRFAIESQHLRSRVVLPVIRHALEGQTSTFRFFEAHGGLTASWRAIVGSIDSLDPDQRREVLVGARATLVALDRALSS